MPVEKFAAAVPVPPGFDDDQQHAGALLEAGGWQVVTARAGDRFPELWRAASRHTASRLGVLEAPAFESASPGEASASRQSAPPLESRP